MGVCVSRGQCPNIVGSTQLRDGSPLTEKKQTRERLSIWKFRDSKEENISPQEFKDLYSSRRSQEFQRSISKTSLDKVITTKEEDTGTVMYVRKVTIDTALSPKRQDQFEEKKIHITGDSIPKGYLASLGIAVTCRKGLKPESPNQDDYSIYIDGAEVMIGVFDGHGPEGHHVAGFIHRQLPAIVSQEEVYAENPLKAFEAGFRKCQNELEEYCEESSGTFDCIISGSTASLILMRGEKIYCGHVGDSRAVLSHLQKDGSRIAIDLTQDHKPTLPSEKQRIEKHRGEVKQLSGDITSRVFVKGKDFPGLAMSRVLGDLLAQEIGVVCEPETSVRTIGEGDEFLILCSDGVWEFISSQEAVDLVAAFGRDHVNGAAEHLAQTAWNRWKSMYSETVDDITAIVAYMPHHENQTTLASSVRSRVD